MMRLFKLPKINKDALLIAYKLLHDALFLLVLSFIAMLIAEGALPGFFSTYISLLRLTIAILLVVAAIVQLGKKLEITHEKTELKKNKLLPFLILLAFLLIGNSLLKFALWENMAITLATLLVFFLFYKLLFSAETK